MLSLGAHQGGIFRPLLGSGRPSRYARLLDRVVVVEKFLAGDDGFVHRPAAGGGGELLLGVVGVVPVGGAERAALEREESGETPLLLWPASTRSFRLGPTVASFGEQGERFGKRVCRKAAGRYAEASTRGPGRGARIANIEPRLGGASIEFTPPRRGANFEHPIAEEEWELGGERVCRASRPSTFRAPLSRCASNGSRLAERTGGAAPYCQAIPRGPGRHVSPAGSGAGPVFRVGRGKGRHRRDACATFLRPSSPTHTLVSS